MRRFITDASHELRTPLTTIRGFAELYRQGAASDVELPDEPHRKRVEPDGPAGRGSAAAGPARRAAAAGSTSVDLLALASDAVHDAQSIAPTRKISMEVFDGPGIPEVLGDEARLRQVLGNLVANALQHTPETAAITVRVGTDGDHAVLEVCDEGPGMGSQDAHRVFERFYRLIPRARARRHWLGLSIVDSLVYAHGGTVSVTTAPARAAGSKCRGLPT